MLSFVQTCLKATLHQQCSDIANSEKMRKWKKISLTTRSRRFDILWDKLFPTLLNITADLVSVGEKIGIPGAYLSLYDNYVNEFIIF